jgi:hypothetical protein
VLINSGDEMSTLDLEGAVREFSARSSGLRVFSTRIEVLHAPHQPKGLPAGKQAIYCFAVPGRYLKIGVAGPNSGARYRSQHYKAGRSLSSLAWSILQHPDLLAAVLRPEDRASVASITWDSVPTWIKQYTTRSNILIDASVPGGVVRDLERFLHGRLAPLFEGRVR